MCLFVSTADLDPDPTWHLREIGEEEARASPPPSLKTRGRRIVCGASLFCIVLVSFPSFFSFPSCSCHCVQTHCHFSWQWMPFIEREEVRALPILPQRKRDGESCGAPLLDFVVLVSFFLEWVTSHTKNVTKQKFEYPFSWVTKRDPKSPLTLFR